MKKRPGLAHLKRKKQSIAKALATATLNEQYIFLFNLAISSGIKRTIEQNFCRRNIGLDVYASKVTLLQFDWKGIL